MTLSGWCRDYVFAPVSSWTRNAYIGVVASMLVLGLWHEISLRFLIWGLYHGLGIAFWQGFQVFKRRFPKIEARWLRYVFTGLSWALTMNFVIIGFAFTNALDLDDSWRILVTIFTFVR